MAFFVCYVMEDNRNFIITEGSRPLWQRFVAAFLFTIAILFLISFITVFEFTTEAKKIEGSFSLLEIALFLGSIGIGFSVVQDVLFDLENKRYKIQYCIGPIKIGKWKKLPIIEYVSVFRQPKEDGEFIYEANLWYNRNQHLNVYENEDREPAFSMGVNVAKILNVRLLDATVANDSKWVEID